MSAGASFDERLAVPWWWWPVGLAIAVLGAAEIHSGASGPLRSVLPYVVLPGLTTLVLVGSSRSRIRLADGVLHVPGARVPVAALGAVTPLDATGVRRWLGPLAQRWAFVALRPWLQSGVRLELADPADDTPYWLIGTRRPAELVAALERARVRP